MHVHREKATRGHREKAAICEPENSYQKPDLPSWTSSLPNCEKTNFCCSSCPDHGILSWQCELTNTGDASKKWKIELPSWFCYPAPGHLSKRIESWVWKRYLHTRVHRSTNHRSQEVEAAQVSSNTWVDKQNVALLMEYYSALKRNGILACLQHGWTLKTLGWLK